jgi:hypothetical protein
VRPLVVALALAPTAAHAEPAGDPAWRVEGRIGLIVPLAGADYTNATGFGGDLGALVNRDWLDLELDVAAFTREDDALAEVLGYRIRGLAGYRYLHRLENDRAIALRALGGVELGGFDDVATSDYAAEDYRLGFAMLLAAESRSVMDWGGIVSLGVAFGISLQPFGDEMTDEANYVGLDVMPNAGIGF